MPNSALPDYQYLLQWMHKTPAFSQWASQLPEQISANLNLKRWGDLPQWQHAIDGLPPLTATNIQLKDKVRIGSNNDHNEASKAQLKTQLMALHPWRKGPWQLFGVDIDTEWRSDWKWDRLLPHLGDISNQHILDVGCGNGYHCMRLLGEGADRVIGIDPSAKFVYQFEAFKHYCPELAVDVLPLGIEHIPANLHCFDTVLSMGVIYHRRDPVAHIQELQGCLKAGGLLVLETLVVTTEQSLVPKGRYAKMRNVWCVPTPEQVIAWMKEAGLTKPRMVDINITSLEEQRATEWMQFESLTDFLNPEDNAHTIEGHPAPQRAIFMAETKTQKHR